MDFKTSKLYYLLLAISLILFNGCTGSQTSDNKESGSKDQASESTTMGKNNVKTIFYNIPSPVEMSELLQKANLVYNSDLMNSLTSIDQYTSTKSMALNLGVYGADLSYTRLYDQIQESINYLSAIRKLSEQLGVPQDEGTFTLNRLEENINNRDSLLLIITDVYANADLYLKENERSGTAALIIFGGWVEALYISTHILNDENPNPEIMERIAEQKYSVDNIIHLLQMYYHENESFNEIFSILNELKTVYEQVELITKQGEVITDEENMQTSIHSKTQIYVNFEQIKEIRNINDKLRNHIVS